mgnify:CR=1 FL=1
MMGHVNMKMIHEHYYSYIKNYQRDDGAAFMTNVYVPTSQGQGAASPDLEVDGQRVAVKK